MWSISLAALGSLTNFPLSVSINSGSMGYYNLLTRGAYRFLGWEYHFELPRFIVYHQDMWGVVHAPSASVLMFIAPLPTNLLSEDME